MPSSVIRRFAYDEMEAALWGALSARMGDDPRGHAPPDVFLNRIKRLLELDTKQAAGIFAVKPPGGSGNAAAYDDCMRRASHAHSADERSVLQGTCAGSKPR